MLLSGGATPEKFERVPDYSYAAGASRFLAGRTIRLDAVLKNFPDRAAVSASLRKDGLNVLERLTQLTTAKGTAWNPRYPVFTN
ncbi:hypothetical protein [Bradyrhizobium sp. 197]|uniref:hypothetical protein n=1 Tax=Bradyrhizobium sp. 197 TaxID=2782663 RepID=UPI001FFAC2E3|nr:hypothetical protein [Bradyrhizobium sp. 197]